MLLCLRQRTKKPQLLQKQASECRVLPSVSSGGLCSKRHLSCLMNSLCAQRSLYVAHSIVRQSQQTHTHSAEHIWGIIRTNEAWNRSNSLSDLFPCSCLVPKNSPDHDLAHLFFFLALYCHSYSVFIFCVCFL